MWMGIPLLVVGSMVGIGGLGLLAVNSDTELFSWTFGAAAAIGVVLSRNVAWHAPWQRTGLRWPYLLALLVVGVALDGREIPSLVAVALGVPCVVLLGYTLKRLRQLDDGCPEAETRDHLIST